MYSGSLSSADWPFGPPYGKLISSSSLSGIDHLSESKTEDKTAVGLKTKSISQKEPSATRIDDRSYRAESSSSLKDIVSVRLLIEQFRQLLPSRSTRKKNLKSAVAPRPFFLNRNRYSSSGASSPSLSDVGPRFTGHRGLSSRKLDRIHEKFPDISQEFDGNVRVPPRSFKDTSSGPDYNHLKVFYF